MKLLELREQTYVTRNKLKSSFTSFKLHVLVMVSGRCRCKSLETPSGTLAGYVLNSFIEQRSIPNCYNKHELEQQL